MTKRIYHGRLTSPKRWCDRHLPQVRGKNAVNRSLEFFLTMNTRGARCLYVREKETWLTRQGRLGDWGSNVNLLTIVCQVLALFASFLYLNDFH